MLARGKVKRAYLSAKIIRADGTVEDLGVIADSNVKEAKKRGIGTIVLEKVREVKNRG